MNENVNNNMSNSMNENVNESMNNSMNNNSKEISKNGVNESPRGTHKTQIWICLGSGGVGKTTLSAALAFREAIQGKRVMVITIDPSQRLKQTLGIHQTGVPLQVDLQEQNVKGELWAELIDHKRTFYDFVMKAAHHSPSAAQILNNPLFVQLSTTLSGSQNFSALEKLYSLYESNEYDLIVLDTPPAQHAIDFLKAPEKLRGLFNEKVIQWFIHKERKNFFLNILQIGTMKAIQAMEYLTGSEFMLELALFFKNIEQWQVALENRIYKMHSMLASSSTSFMLVTNLDPSKLNESVLFAKEIRKMGFSLKEVYINRAYPLWAKDLNYIKTFNNFNRIENHHPGSAHEKHETKEWIELYNDFVNYYSEKLQLYRGYMDKIQKEISTFVIPEGNEDISNLEGVKWMVQNISKNKLIL